MHLRVPRRYRRGQRRSILSLRWLWLWLLTPLVVYFGVQILQNREAYLPLVEQRLEDARRVLATALAPTALPTADPAVRRRLADAAWQRGAIDEATALYAELARALPDAPELHRRLALALALGNRPTEALAAAENAITADPFSADAWALRALAQDRNGDYPAAIASARHALELAGETQPQAAARAGAYLAEALYDLEYYERAFNTVNRALQADPDSPEALRVRALIYELARYDFDAALADLQRAHELAPHLPYITIDLALLHHYRFEDVDTAVALLGDLVELNPRNSAALYALGTLYLRALGDQDKASGYFMRCIESNARNSSCHYMLGRTQERSKQYSSAAASFRRAIEIGPENAYHYWWAANVEILQGNCVAAIPWLQHGYRLAQANENEELVGNYEYLMESCGLLALPGAAPNQG